MRCWRRDKRQIKLIFRESPPPPSPTPLTLPLSLFDPSSVATAAAASSSIGIGIISSGIDSLIIQIINKRSADDLDCCCCLYCCCCCWPGQKRRLMARFSFEKCSGAGQRQADRLRVRVELEESFWPLESRFESEKCVRRRRRWHPLNFAAKR